MFQSKPIKDFEPASKLYLWWLESRVGDWYYHITWEYFQKPISHVKKMWGWYWNVFRWDFDFDGHSLFAIIEYKLKRIEKVLLNGNAIQDPKDMKALKLAIKLAGRLKDDKYDEKAYDRHVKKWGEPKYWFEPVNDGTDHSYYRSSRPKVITEEDKKQSDQDRRDFYLAADAKSKKEEKWFYAILHKYLRNLWD